MSRSIRKWPFEENRRGRLFRKSPIYEVMSKKTFEFSNFYNFLLKIHT
jgi:hypothetical protein